MSILGECQCRIQKVLTMAHLLRFPLMDDVNRNRQLCITMLDNHQPERVQVVFTAKVFVTDVGLWLLADHFRLDQV